MANRDDKRPTHTVPFVKHKTEDVTYFGNPVIDNMMTALVAVTAEVWSTRRRMKVLEALLETKGVTTEMVENFMPSEKQTKEWAEDRDAFIQRTMSVLAREASMPMSAEWTEQEFPDYSGKSP
ncbi:MAG: hypothetical protein FJX59_16415 [Alphaproteobacteria bacterium]|nr:hypothetical protein [Alphaproteobacteria bacterium]